MVKWFKSLSRQEKVMLLLILVLLIGVILRWDNVKRKALIWFRADELVERQGVSGLGCPDYFRSISLAKTALRLCSTLSKFPQRAWMR